MQVFEEENANLFMILFFKDLLFAQRCVIIVRAFGEIRTMFEGEAIEPHRIEPVSSNFRLKHVNDT